MTRAASLHRRIYDDIERAILSGAWPPGRRIPFEHELTARYACSRMTVSKAISELADRGLVVRRRRAGTFVAAPRTHAAVLAIPDLAAEIEGRGQAYGYRLLERMIQAPRTAGEADLAAGGDLLFLASLHSADELPLAVEHRLIALSATPEAEAVDFKRTPPGGWLLRHAPWTEAEHRITAAPASASEAGLLDIEASAACLCLERQTWRDGVGLTQVRQTFPGDRYDLVARFSPSRADRA